MTPEEIAKKLSDLITDDVYSVSKSDNPSSSLTATLFNGSNFINWDRAVRMSLGTKEKLGFIDGSIKKPNESEKEFSRWLRCDRLVACWILSSMTPEIANSFIYTTSAYDLWKEIAERFGESNASMLYQVKMESMRILQGNLSVTAYYNKLKKCWDDIQCLNGIPGCSCGHMAKCTCKILQRVQELESQDRLLHFLINLNQEYDATKNQILSTVPAPSLNSAYQTVLQVEKQKQLSANVANNLEPTAFMAGSHGQNTGNSTADGQNQMGGNNFRKDVKKLNNDRKFCNLCSMKGHTADMCFEVIGYPDWYKGKKGKRSGKMAANVAQEDNPLHVGEIPSTGRYSSIDPEQLTSMYQEMVRMFKASNLPQNFSGPSE